MYVTYVYVYSTYTYERNTLCYDMIIEMEDRIFSCTGYIQIQKQ